MNYGFNSIFRPFNPLKPTITPHHNHYHITFSSSVNFPQISPQSPFCAPLVSPRDNSSLLPPSIPFPYFNRSAGRWRLVRPFVVPISPRMSTEYRLRSPSSIQPRPVKHQPTNTQGSGRDPCRRSNPSVIRPVLAYTYLLEVYHMCGVVWIVWIVIVQYCQYSITRHSCAATPQWRPFRALAL